MIIDFYPGLRVVVALGEHEKRHGEVLDREASWVSFAYPELGDDYEVVRLDGESGRADGRGGRGGQVLTFKQFNLLPEML